MSVLKSIRAGLVIGSFMAGAVIVGCGEQGTDGSSQPATGSDDSASTGSTSPGGSVASSGSSLDDVLRRQKEAAAAWEAEQQAEASKAFANAEIPSSSEVAGGTSLTGDGDVSVDMFETNPNVVLAFEPVEMLDFGMVYDRSPLNGVVRFVNAGTEPLRIQDVRTTCGCTAVNAERFRNREYLPGEGDMIEVGFTPQTDGMNRKAVVIQSNASSGRAVRFPIQAEVVAPIRTSSGLLRMDEVAAGTQGETSFVIESRDPNVEIISIGTTSRRDVFEFSTEVLDDGDADYPGRVRVTARTTSDTPVGMFNERIQVTASAKIPEIEAEQRSTLNVSVRGTVGSLVESATRYMRVPTVEPGDAFTAKLLMTHVNGEAFEVVSHSFSSAMMSTASLELEVNDVEGGKELILTGTVPMDARGPRLIGEIELRFDIDGHGPMIVSFNGAIVGAQPVNNPPRLNPAESQS